MISLDDEVRHVKKEKHFVTVDGKEFVVWIWEDGSIDEIRRIMGILEACGIRCYPLVPYVKRETRLVRYAIPCGD